MAELAWPEDLGHGTFVGRFGFMDADSHDPDREPDITSATGGTVTITPSIKSVRYSGVQGPMILAARPARGVIDSEGYLCTAAEDGSAGDRGMVFPATDDTDLNPTDWTYEVSIILDGQVRLATFSVKLPEGSTVDLSLAVPVPPSGGTAIVVDPTTAERAENAATRAEAAADAAEEWAPTFQWDGTYLVVDGVPSPNLKGEKGDTPTWEDLPGKPTSFPPATHTHEIADVDGLKTQLDAIGYDSGERDITSRVPDVVSGRVLVWRLGRTVHLTFDSLIVAAPDTPHWLTVSGLIPLGFRGASRSRYYQFAQQVGSYAAGPIRIDASGNVVIYNAKQGNGETRVIQGTVAYPTPADLPATLPGTPA